MAKRKPSKATNGKAEKPPTEGVYFLSLSLENVRCFGPKQTLDLSDGNGRPARWTILLGNNGTGKTTVLQTLAGFSKVAADRQVNPLPVYQFSHLLANVRAEIALEGSLANSVSHYRREAVISEWIHEPGERVSVLKHEREPRFIDCFGYGASRRLGRASRLNEENDYASASLFSYEAELRDAEDWLLKVDYQSNKPGRHQHQWTSRLAQTKELLLELLPDVTAIRFETAPGTYPVSRVEFETPYGWVPLRQLGYGYQTLIAWMVDFASRLVERYPDSPNPLAEPAVVLVDEIDLHMHPVWQRKLIGDLTKHFPNTQFIATAHSPLVVQAAGDANLAVLRREGDHVVIDNEKGAVQGWRVDQILTSELFDLPTAYPPKFDQPLQRRKELLTKPKRTAAEERELAGLEKAIDSLPVGETPDQVKTMTLLRETLDVLQQRVPPKP